MAHAPRSVGTHVPPESAKITANLARLFDLVGRHRVRASVLVFTLLIVIDMVSGLKPHDVADLGDPFTVAGVSLVLCGLTLRSWAAGILKKDSVLTTTGPYQLMRHPLYCGSFLMMLGFCTIIADYVNYVVVLGPVLGMYLLKLHDEERSLAARFGADWANYARRTRRLIPRWGFVNLRSDWTWTQWRLSREYQAVAATLVALVGLKLWRNW
jgi:protein-S-isoprenylcysteine O-methyltransferase Ste14